MEENDLEDLSRALHPQKVKYTFISSECVPFYKTKYLQGHKTYLHKRKRTDTISTILPEYDVLKMEINHKKKAWKRILVQNC